MLKVDYSIAAHGIIACFERPGRLNDQHNYMTSVGLKHVAQGKAWPRLLGAGLLALLALLSATPGLLGWLPQALFAAPLAALSALALFTLPGMALLRLLPAGSLRPAQYVAAALGLSWVLPPLLLLAADLLGLRWGSALAWLSLALCALVAFWPQRDPRPRQWQPDTEAGLLLLIFGLALAVRLYLVRDLPGGLYGDSYHHTMISQLLVDNGGLFRSWQPYAPLATLTYHFGFHSMAAWLHWLSGYPVRLAVLVVGQVAGALAAPGIFLLGDQLFGERRAALWAALVVAFVSLFPAYYVNWGRYTQLAGQTVLPVACFVWMLLLERAVDPTASLRSLLGPSLLAGLATAGMALAHYRIAVFGACFVLIYALALLVTRVRSLRAWARLVALGALAGSLGLGLTLPWLLRMREGRMLQLASHLTATNIGTGTGNEQPAFAFAQATANGLLPLALLGLLALLVQRRWFALIIPLWLGLVWLTANPYLLGLTGAGIISSFTVLIGGYLWLAPLAGAGLAALCSGTAWLVARLSRLPIDQARTSVALLLATGLLIWGLGQQSRMLDLNYQLLTNADLEAATWLREHVPPDAQIFVNSFPAYNSYVYAGSDGGWWLPLLSGRQTNLPPISYGFEAAEDPRYALLVQERNQAVLAQPVERPEAGAALRDWGYSYLYDGPAMNPAPEYLDPVRIAASGQYEQIYQRDGVTIWRVR